MVDIAHGHRAVLEEIEETTWNTTPGTPSSNYLDYETESLDAPADFRFSANQPRDRVPTHGTRGRKKPGGGITSDFNLKGFGTLLKHALGSNNTTGTGPYTHTIRPAATLPPGRTIHKFLSDLGKGFKFTGCRVGRLSMECPNEGDVKITQDLLAGDVAITSALLDATPTGMADKQAVEWEGALKIDDTLVSLFESFRWELDNGGKMLYGLGSEAAIAPGLALRRVTGTASMFVTNPDYFTQWAKFYGRTSAKLEITITQGTYSCKIVFPAVFYGGGHIPKVGNADELFAGIPFNAVKGTSGNDIEIDLVNGVATI